MATRFNPTRIFIVEDDPIYSKMINYVAELNPEHEVHIFSTGKQCLSKLHLKPTLVSLDYSLPDYKGEELLQIIKSTNPSIAVVILSGQNDISVAVQLLKMGAYDYIVKDDQTKDRFFNTIENIKKKEKVIKLIKKAVRSNITISITGETGTGKEVVARTIHFNSKRNQGKFVAVNVSAIPSELLESELFGYEKGAFTGANSRKIGLFELADKGTLFLDEIGEMNINIQAKLLRALQERQIKRVGGNEWISFDTRLIVATHRDLAKEVSLGNFREDLYYRLLGLPITLPPLRERGKDVHILIHHFIEEYRVENNLRKLSISDEAKEKLFQYSFPGNIRELKAIIELAAVICENRNILPDDIVFNNPLGAKSILLEEKTLREHTMEIINHYLNKYNNDVRKVAKKLGIGKSTIYRLLKEEKTIIEKQRKSLKSA